MTTAMHHTGWPGTDLRPLLDTLPARPRLLGLGEPTHGADEFLLVRNDVLRHLVEHEGYRSVAVESDCLAGLTVDRYTAGGPGTPDDVARDGFSHGFGELPGNRALLAWLRGHNAGLPVAQQVRFYGFDAPVEMMGAPSPREPLLALHAYLSEHLDDVPGSAAEIDGLAGEEDRWRDERAMLEGVHPAGTSAGATRLRALADDLAAMLHAETPRLLPRSAEEFWTADLRARTAAGLCRYHAAMGSQGDARLARLCAQRDTMMADNLAAIVGREHRRGPTLVFAHNAHLQRPRSSMRLGPHVVRWWSAGAITAARFGTAFAHVAMDVGTAPRLDIPEPAADTLAGTLGAAAGHRHVFASARLVAALGDRLSAAAARTDLAGNHRYAPLHPEHVAHTDGVLFLREITGAG